MAKYKYAGSNITDGVLEVEANKSIPNDVKNIDWIEYQQWVIDGGITDPWKTEQELIDIARSNAAITLDNYHSDLYSAVFLGDQKQEIKADKKYNKALRKEFKGNANQGDVDYLDFFDDVADYYEDSDQERDKELQWINHQNRTEQELLDYDPSLANWPVPPVDPS